MALIIDDPEVERLATEVAAKMGITEIAAICEALRSARRAFGIVQRPDRAEDLLEVMRTEIRPLITDRRPVLRSEREQTLGYDPATGV
ncbi:hypothetical protein Mycsm_07013 (plasmid) [Mycobacterium sp. JS623]|uniref:type II toxin-antitoxin system VapB family antitoxin n=1 Tax=Mycobacterium sp. JS623 TaxID=212767 RepID=UPI0002A55803|nr:type II toxin-antitoxin system VapB family antitoxin [Mycobacterium sp. JS623]AGB27113.1 hypothetical protein Mycsm_07013 [Mycobacterium sp. JS623]